MPNGHRPACQHRWPLINPNEEDMQHQRVHECTNTDEAHRGPHRCACGEENE